MVIQKLNSQKELSRTLYKTLLRTAKHFTCEKNGPVLSCLLYRSGFEDFLEHPYEIGGQNQITSAPASALSMLSNEESISSSSTANDTTAATSNATAFIQDSNRTTTAERYMAIEQARDLSRPYSSLLKYQRSRNSNNNNQEKQEEEYTRTESYHSHNNNIQIDNDDVPLHVHLYKKLVKEVIGPGVYMHFPSKIKQDGKDNVMTRLLKVIKREFRATDSSLSKSYSEKTRQQLAFLTLKELQKKLVWAESLGLHIDADDDDYNSNGEYGDDYDDDEDYDDDDSDDDVGHDMNQFAARNVEKLPLSPSSSYLQPGTFLIAHPLMTGCFARSVICLLQHTPPTTSNDVTFKNTNTNTIEQEEEEGCNMDSGGGISGGGTYGLIINQPIKTGVPYADSERSRNKTLREVIRYDCLPEGIKVAFGESNVRNGGPVNVSVQMLRYVSPDEEEKCKIGGSVLPMATVPLDHHGHAHGHGHTHDHDSAEMSTTPDSGGEVIRSAAMDTNSAVYFGGDIIKAAQAVIDGDIQQDSFSFFIGASCWEPGQLESEVKKGYWIPCSAPPELAHSGLCNLEGIHDVQASESSLWVSMMAAIGGEEGRLAEIFEEFEYDENGYPCDEV